MLQATTLDWAVDAQEQAERKVLALAERLGNVFLHNTVDDRYVPCEGHWWTSGFWPGMLWLVYRRTRSPHLALLAHDAEDELERIIIDERFYGLHHDVGFQFQPTAVMRYKLTGDPSARRRGLLAAALLMSRFNVVCNVMEAWNGGAKEGLAIIDTMMNLPLLFWAAQETDRPRYRHMANAHAHTAMRQFVRPDGSTHHIWRFDRETGQPVEALGGQGYAPDSAWSRGQAWALYGFAVAYRYTQLPEYLQTAQQVADNFVAALPPQGVPPWDFRAPDAVTAPRDSSAGAVAASGLLDLADLLGEHGAPYYHAAVDLLQALNQRSATWDDPHHDALLRHATGKLPLNENINVSLIYGDYYFLEALQKLNGIKQTCW